MKIIEVRKEVFDRPYPGLNEVAERLDARGPGYQIDTLNWKDFCYRPDVRFNIAYDEKEIFIRYHVAEEYFKAEKMETNEMVCEDSCVEFFVSPAEDGIYYNFEFNAIGTCLLGTGTGRPDNKRAPGNIISGIRRQGSVTDGPKPERQGRFFWTLTLGLPFETFFRHKITDLKGKTIMANFYKCGDRLTVPHYLSWNPVKTEKPDFHRPEYFGILKFI